jgi:hypothetical protein
MVESVLQRWLTSSQAARYCGYKSVKHFLKIAREYNIPRYGPRNNRFDRFDLDEWMKNPHIFLNTLTKPARHTFRKVEV